MAEDMRIATGTYASLATEVKSEQLKVEKERRERQFDEKLDQLADKAIEFMRTRGKEDSLTIMLQTFLEVALQLKDAMQSLKAINVAMDCLGEAISFLDASINFDDNIVSQMNSKSYGFFARWKMKRKLKKAMRNNVGRIKATIDGLAMKYDIATAIADSLLDFSKELNKTIAKRNEKKAKKAKKDGKPETPVNEFSAAERYISNKLQEMGEDGSGDGSTPPTQPTQPSSGSGDISDIL